MAVSIIAPGVNGMAQPTLNYNPKIAHQYWWLILGLVLLAGSQFFPETLLWQREKILDGELWRLLTGHWLHLNVPHFVLNIMAGLVLMVWLKPYVSFAEIALQLFLLSTLLSLCLLVFIPQLDWYGGLSGILHGLLCLYSIRLCFSQRSPWWAGIFLLVWVKIAVEQYAGSTSQVVLLDDFAVVLEAHLLGAILGTLLATLQALIKSVHFRH